MIKSFNNSDYEGEIVRMKILHSLFLMCSALMEYDGFTLDGVNKPNTMAIIQMEVEDFFDDAEECGSSDWFYLRMSIF